MRKMLLMVTLAASMAPAARAGATLVSMDYTNSYTPVPVHATAILNVVGGQAISGTGTISGGGLIGTKA